MHLITNQRLPPESNLSGRFYISEMTEETGDTTAHHVAAKFKKDKEPKGESRRSNDRLTMHFCEGDEK